MKLYNLLLITTILLVSVALYNNFSNMMEAELDKEGVIVVYSVVYSTEYVIEELNEEDSKEYIINFLGDITFYLQLFHNDYQHLVNTGVTLIVSNYEKCNKDRDACTLGMFTGDQILIYKTVINRPEEMIETFLHEVGHLIQYYYFNETDYEEWIMIYSNAERFNRGYAKKNHKEDFAVHYVHYKLGLTIPEDRIDFIKKIEKKAKADIKDYTNEVVVVIYVD